MRDYVERQVTFEARMCGKKKRKIHLAKITLKRSGKPKERKNPAI
jgi:hypothetical protein